jgi:hypothetical protein
VSSLSFLIRDGRPKGFFFVCVVVEMRDSDCAGLHYKTGRAVWMEKQQHTRERHGMMADRWVSYFFPSIFMTHRRHFFFHSFFFARLLLSKRNFFIHHYHHHHHHPFNLTYFPHM